MRALLVVESNPVSDHALALEAVAMRALLLECQYHALQHSVLLWAVRRNEFLLQTIAAYQASVVAAGEDQVVARAQQKWLRHASQRTKVCDQGLLHGG